MAATEISLSEGLPQIALKLLVWQIGVHFWRGQNKNSHFPSIQTSTSGICIKDEWACHQDNRKPHVLTLHHVTVLFSPYRLNRSSEPLQPPVKMLTHRLPHRKTIEHDEEECTLWRGSIYSFILFIQQSKQRSRLCCNTDSFVSITVKVQIKGPLCPLWWSFQSLLAPLKAPQQIIITWTLTGYISIEMCQNY